MTPGLFIDLDYFSSRKHSENICGDVFMSSRPDGENRLIAVLSDGLGSGVKANVLATMTASMSLKFAGNNSDFLRSAEIIMKALPVCSERKISYATFTIADTSFDGNIRIIEMGNPRFLHFNGAEEMPCISHELNSCEGAGRSIRFSELSACGGDRIIFFSDGVTQAGIGSPALSTGWQVSGCRDFIAAELAENSDISSRILATKIVKKAMSHEKDGLVRDDMTCVVMQFRTPRRMLLVSGPPFNAERDGEWAAAAAAFQGVRVVCGGSTAKVMSRELGRKLKIKLRECVSELPPSSEMDGFQLITEGILTLTRTAQLLEEPEIFTPKNDAAAQLAEILRSHDIIEIVTGTRINEAQQYPNIPEDMDIRRNIIRRIERILRTKYLKETHIKYI